MVARRVCGKICKGAGRHVVEGFDNLREALRYLSLKWENVEYKRGRKRGTYTVMFSKRRKDSK